MNDFFNRFPNLPIANMRSLKHIQNHWRVLAQDFLLADEPVPLKRKTQRSDGLLFESKVLSAPKKWRSSPSKASFHLHEAHRNTNLQPQNQDLYGKEYLSINQHINLFTYHLRNLTLQIFCDCSHNGNANKSTFSIFQFSEAIFINNNHFPSLLKSKTKNCKDRFKILRIEK